MSYVSECFQHLQILFCCCYIFVLQVLELSACEFLLVIFCLFVSV